MNSFVKKISFMSFMVFSLSVSICLGQNDPNNLFTKKGKLISKQNSAVSDGKIEITQYRIEQVKLTQPLDKGANKPSLENVFRIVIVTAKPLPFDDYSIWTNYIQTDAYLIKPNAVAIIIYARTLPNDSIKLALSKRSESDLDSRLVLPGTLSVPSEYATSFEEMQASLPIIELRRIGNQIPYTEIRIKIPGSECRIGNALIVLEISGKEFAIDCDDEVFIYRFTTQEFSQLIDGAEIIIKSGVGRESRNRGVVGRLNKSQVQ